MKGTTILIGVGLVVGGILVYRALAPQPVAPSTNWGSFFTGVKSLFTSGSSAPVDHGTAGSPGAWD